MLTAVRMVGTGVVAATNLEQRAARRLTVHVLEAVDPAAAILEFTRVNQVDHIVIGDGKNYSFSKGDFFQ